MDDKESPIAIQDTSVWQSELMRFAVLAILGAAFSYLSVNIPNTEAFFDVRWIFGFVGFALLRRWWEAVLLAAILSLAGFHKVSLMTALLGNMLYSIPNLLVTRFAHKRLLSRIHPLIGYGLTWLAIVLLCYQLSNTPVIWGFMAYLQDAPIWPSVLVGWRTQPFLIESLIVGVVSGLGLMVARSSAALLASRRELAITLYSIGDGVIATDTRGCVKRMNPVAEQLTGWQEVEARGKPLETVFCILNEDTRQIVENPVEQVLAEGHIVGLANHTLLRARDGIERPIVDSAAPIRDENGLVSGVVLIFRDQTAERRIQKALEESHERLLLALRNARMGVWDLDVETEYVDWYGEHFSLFGLPTETFGGTLKDIRESIHPDDREANQATLRRTLESGADFDSTYRVIWPDGSTHWMHSYGKLSHDNGQPQRIVGTTQDITTRKQMERERVHLVAQIRKQAKQLEQILATVPAGVILLDAQGQILQANPVAKEDLPILTEHEENRVLTHLGGRPLAELLTSPPTKGLWHELHADDQTFEVIARPVEPNAEPGHWVLAINDVTQERQIRARLQQQDRLVAVGQLAAGIAHDFNNIMATIVLYAQMASQSPELSQATQDKIAIIDQQAWHATELIEQLLDFGRQAVMEHQPLDLLALLQQQIKLLERTLPEHIEIKLESEPGLHIVDADPTRLQQMLTNLAVNARDAMPEGGVLRIKLAQIHMTDAQTPPIPGMKTGRWVKLSVSDTGTGIASEILPHIFDPFFTTKKPGEGSGLGLSQVHGIVKKHAGEIDVTTHVGQGTTFNIYLPALSEPPSEGQLIETGSLVSGDGETILVVEDNHSLREALEESLTLLNYQVIATANGKEALETVKQHRDDIALILSDLVMPEMGGQALFHALHERSITVPVIILTGHPMKTELEALQTQGLAGWMLKPPDMEALSKLLTQTIHQEP